MAPEVKSIMSTLLTVVVGSLTVRLPDALVPLKRLEPLAGTAQSSVM